MISTDYTEYVARERKLIASDEMYSAIKDAIKHGRLLPKSVANKLIAAMDKADGKA